MSLSTKYDRIRNYQVDRREDIVDENLDDFENVKMDDFDIAKYTEQTFKVYGMNALVSM